MGNIILKNCKMIDEEVVNIIVEDGKIKEIKKTLKPSDTTTDKIIDIKENIIIPGLIDTHVHLRDPGLTHKETWTTGSQAAANGGYTTIVDMPNTIPKTDTYDAFKDKKENALKNSYTDFALNAGVKSKKDVDEILTLKPAAYKIFMDLHDNNQLDEMFSYIQDTNKPLLLHCEDKTLVDYNIKTLSANEENDMKLTTYSYARSAMAEFIAVNHAIELAKKYNIQLHICHLSCRDTFELVNEAKGKINITVEATPHHLFLDNETYNTYGMRAKTNPPLRDINHNITLDNLSSIDSIGTDHAPHTLEEKDKNTWTTASGIPGLEVTLKLLLTEVNNGKITLKDVVEKTSTNPAKIFNMKNKGEIKPGYDADFTIVDMKKSGKIDVDEFKTMGKYTPFENRQYTGSNIMTINRGNIISDTEDVYKYDAKYIY